MSTEVFRKYIDIINENTQSPVQLDEGMIDSIKQKISQLAQKMFSPEDMARMKQAVEKATGKPIEQVSVRDLGGDTAVAIATSLGAKPTSAVNEAKLNELFGLGKEDPRITALRQQGFSDDTLKDYQHELDYRKYGFTGPQLIQRIAGISTTLGGLAGLVSTVMGSTPTWAGVIAFVAFIVGSFITRGAD